MRTWVGILVCVTLAASAGPVSAQTFIERLECTGDALRLCSAFVPNHKLVANCMELKHAQLSPACRSVFDAGLAALRNEGRPIP